MPVDEVIYEVRQLYQQLVDDNESREQQIKQAKNNTSGARRR